MCRILSFMLGVVLCVGLPAVPACVLYYWAGLPEVAILVWLVGAVFLATAADMARG